MIHTLACPDPPASVWTAAAGAVPATRPLEGDRRAGVVVLDTAEPGPVPPP